MQFGIIVALMPWWALVAYVLWPLPTVPTSLNLLYTCALLVHMQENLSPVVQEADVNILVSLYDYCGLA